MPVQDGDFMLRDGSIDLASTENGDGVLVGPCPLNGMLLLVHCEAGTSPAFTVALQESSDDGDSDAYANAAAPGAKVIASAGTELFRAFWTEDYVRMRINPYTTTGGAVEVSLVQGGEPT